MTEWLRGAGSSVLLVASVAACALALPPQIAFQSQPWLGLGFVTIGAAALLWRGQRTPAKIRKGVAATLLWGLVAWCVLSQPMPLSRPSAYYWSLRALLVAVLAGVWLLWRVDQRWQRRALVALMLPTVSGLALAAWVSPPQPSDFMPYYVAVDSQGTVYVTDEQAPVIRVFGADGVLRAKLRPGLAGLRDMPGAGLFPPGPYNDPERLGVSYATGGARQVPAALRPWPAGTDDFWFCGIAIGHADRLFVVDWMRGRLLRFAPDGRLEVRAALPASYHPSLGCVATAGDQVLLSDESGVVLTLDDTGHLVGSLRLPEAISGGISASPDGRTIYALARARVYVLSTAPPYEASGIITSWALPTPDGPLVQPYHAILALESRVLVTDVGQRRVRVYSRAGEARPAIGSPGAQAGQFGQVGGLARDTAGQIYVADLDHRVLQRFTMAGVVDALIRSPDDDEID